MFLHQVANAVSMVFPLLAVFKHRRVPSALKRLVPIHVPFSVAYHLSMAFPQTRRVARLTRFLFSADILFIHLTSLTASYEYRKRRGHKATKTVALLPFHTLSLAKTVSHKDQPIFRCALVVVDHIHLVRRPNRGRLMRISSMAAFCFLVSYHSSFPITHSLFHALLYNMYDEHFKMCKSHSSKDLPALCRR